MTEKRELEIAGVHHISIKARSLEQMEKTVDFYHNILNMEIIRKWGQGDSSACMVDAGGCLLEIMASGQEEDDGVVNHFALATSQVDQWIEKIRNQGYAVTMEPQDKLLPAQPPFPVRIAFFRGPAGELVELMEERKE
jgi:glyoxylase I family protein